MTLSVRSNDFRLALVEAQFRECSTKERWMFSLKTLGLFWALAGFCFFIPVAHFILVPTFLLSGVIGFFLQIKKTHFVQDLHFPCPKCQAKNSYGEKIFLFRDEMRFYCVGCAEQLVVSPIRAET